MLYSLCSAAGAVLSVAIAVLAAGAFAAVVILHFVRKKQGKGGCGCDCAHCGGCCHLHKKEDKE